MTFGASLVLIAIGAILRYAITAHVNGVNLSTVGNVLMIVGVIGAILGILMLMMRRRTDVVHHEDGATYVAPSDTLRGPY